MERDYMLIRDELRHSRDYISYNVTFTVTLSAAAVDATVTFNGEIKETGDTGIVVFYYVSAGVNQEYTVAYSGYSETAEVDITGNTSIAVELGD